MRTRIIVVGAAWYGDWAKNFYRAFLHLGYNAAIVYNNSAPAPLGGNSDQVTSLFEKSKARVRRLSPGLFRILKKIRQRFSEYEILSRVGRVDVKTERVIVIFTWTPPSPWVLKKLKSRRGVTLALWHGEPPVRDRSWDLAYPYFDHLYIVDEGIWMDELPAEEKKRVGLLPLSSDGTMFSLLSEKDEKYQADISFVGQYVASRAEALGLLKDHNLKIYGFGWERGFEKYPWLKDNYFGPLPTEALNMVYNNTKVVIGTLGDPTDPHTTATMRTFDIALAGAFQVSQDVALTKKIFHQTVRTYKGDAEMVELVQYYLSHEDEREKLAAESHTIALGHTYEERAKAILRDCGIVIILCSSPI